MKVLILISALVLMTACGKQVSKTNPKDTPTGNPGVFENPMPTPDGQGFYNSISCSVPLRCSSIEIDQRFSVYFPNEFMVENGKTEIKVTILTADRGTETCEYHQTGTEGVWKRSNSSICRAKIELFSGDLIVFEGDFHRIPQIEFNP